MPDKPDQTEAPSLYERDFYGWAMQTARAVRERRFGAVDWEAVAEELEGMGRSEKREITNRLVILLVHLLKWRFQPERRGRSWRLTLQEQRDRAELLLEENPSLRPEQDDMVRAAYRLAVTRAARQTGLDLPGFPATCPWTWDQILDPDFLPE